jgi:hypothetical protein
MFKFDDGLNRLGIAYDLMRQSISAYGGGVTATIQTEDSYGKPATVEIEANCHLGWRGACNGPEGWTSYGKITWKTSGGHLVIFEFGDHGDLKRVSVGGDKSEYLYPSIEAVCKEDGVEFAVLEHAKA